MKQRKGFVSNSSSTSFIIGLEKDIENYSISQLKQLFFHNNYAFDFDELDDLGMTLDEVLFKLLEGLEFIGRIVAGQVYLFNSFCTSKFDLNSLYKKTTTQMKIAKEEIDALLNKIEGLSSEDIFEIIDRNEFKKEILNKFGDNRELYYFSSGRDNDNFDIFLKSAEVFKQLPHFVTFL